MKKFSLLQGILLIVIAVFLNIITPLQLLSQNDYAIIYVNRLKKSTNQNVTYNVWFNNNNIGELKKTNVAVSTDAKEKWLIAKYNTTGKFYLRLTSGKDNKEADRLLMDVVIGKSYFVEFDPAAPYGEKALRIMGFNEGATLFAKSDEGNITFANSDIKSVVMDRKNQLVEDLYTYNDDRSSTGTNTNITPTNNTGKDFNDSRNANALSIINPQLGANNTFISTKPELSVRGKIIDGIVNPTVIINGESISLTPDKFFEKNIVLSYGVNTIGIIAKDGNGVIVGRQKLVVEYNPQSQANTGLMTTGVYYALIIAVNEYDDPEINDLDKPISDAQKLYEVLTSSYTFEPTRVKFLKNAKYEDIVIAFDEITKKIGAQDNFLIFYAGHGHWDESTGVGYWLPSDARKSNTAKWFRNSTLKDYIGAIKSKHTILIADACFSGGIFKTRKAFSDAPLAVEKLYELNSRKAMTSGTLTEVPDKSVFLQYLIKRLQENKEKYVSSEQLFTSFRQAVLSNSPAVPQFGEIKDVGDEGGDFIFIKKGQ